ncbi:hypothetical protein [Demequina rhizosphaerae]|uniref:hypothetical protein n=1 Tax=Demequina rhizosphaerae TaxID=1638985 RepID=UPI000784C79B|nr:hypothetical protein [Demequina rhizosphaerae]
MSKCLSCFRPLPDNEFAVACGNSECKKWDTDTIATAFMGHECKSGPQIELTPPKEGDKRWRPDLNGPCPECSKPMREVCPTCRHPLPAGVRDALVTTIAMCGARSTGKSVYIAVAIQQLKRWMADNSRSVKPMPGSARPFVPGADTTEGFYEASYFSPVYSNLQIIKPTATTSQRFSIPMVWDLGTIERREGMSRVSRRVLLAIRDVAGEEVTTLPSDATHLEFFRYADGVFFMFDPLALPAVHHRLMDIVPTNMTGGDPTAVLHNLQQLMGAGARGRLAVILSKFDALHALKDVEDAVFSPVMQHQGAAFVRDTRLDGLHYDDADGSLLTAELESLMTLLDAKDFLLHVDSIGVEHRYFAVSVLGSSPKGNTLSEMGISPYRLLDPLKWTLAGTGAISLT